MHNSVIDIQAGELSPLLISLNKTVDKEDLALYIYEDGEYTKKSNSFENAGDLLYKTSLKFNEIGYVQIRVMVDDDVVASALLHVTNTIKTLIDAQLGNWEIKNNQMIFYKTDNSELTRFDLYDKDGKKTTFGVVKRERV